MRRLRQLWSHEGGNTALIFGLAAIPLIALGGGIVDFANRAQVKGELQTSADTAAIAAARVMQLGELTRQSDMEAVRSEAVDAATRILDASLAKHGGSGVASVTIEDPDSDGNEVIRIAAQIDVDTSFLGVLGIGHLTAATSSQVNLPEPILIEIAMVLDYSGSMNTNDKYIRMTDAAQTFIGRVETERTETTKIGIVPFSEYVLTEIDGSAIRVSGGDDDDDDDGGGGGGYSGIVTKCLLNRDYPYSASDQPPSTGIPGTQWPEGSSSKCNDYVAANLQARDLTDDFQGLSDALASMTPLGLTNISLGMEMGWHMLTPPKPFETARDFSDDDLRKVIILLTDGKQTVAAEGPSGGPSVAAANETTAELCGNAKGFGIRIFSIAYDVTDPDVEALLRNCATDTDSYYDPNVSEISEVFDEIYQQIAESVWVSQ